MPQESPILVAPILMDIEGYGLPEPGETPFWFLQGTAQHGTGLAAAWTMASGRTVRMGLLDTGVNHAHSDFMPDNMAALGQSGPVAPTDPHGTRVAGLISGRIDNAIGGMGGATGVNLYVETLDFKASPSIAAMAEALERQAGFDVSNNSWGWVRGFTDNFSKASFAPIAAALATGANDGRDGLGTVWVFAGGNGRVMRDGQNTGDDSNFHNMSNARQAIAVGATDADGKVTIFSSPGTNLLLVAPGQALATTDGLDVGATGRAWASGTSFSAPLVSAAVALILEVNPELGYRDVQQILAMTARPLDSAPGSANGARTVNGGGLVYSRDAGFGLLDAEAAVRLARDYKGGSTAANEVSFAALFASAPDLAGLSTQQRFTLTVPPVSAGLQLEWAELTLDLYDPALRSLSITLISPAGTVSVIAPNLNAAGNTTALNFRFSSQSFRGEMPEGKWTLVLDNPAGTAGVVVNTAALGLYGAPGGDDGQRWFTDAFAKLALEDPARRVIAHEAEAAGTLNFAALAGAAVVDLSAGTGTLEGVDLTLASDFATVLGGAGADSLRGSDGTETLSGNDGNDTLRGLGGADLLVGGAGDDLLEGGAGAATLDGGPGLDLASYEGSASAVNVSLLTGFRAGGHAAGDVWISIEGFIGSDFNDTLNGDHGANLLRGGAGDDILRGRGGADTLEGGAGFDIASYSDSKAGVNVSLLTGWAKGGDAVGDVWWAIEGFIGSDFNDTLNGDHGANLLRGGAGDDILQGRGGADTLEGGAGIDLASYVDSNRGVNVSLLTGYAAGGHALGDVWHSIEGFIGSRFNDTLNGGNGNDILEGGAGNDVLRGRGGMDTFVFGHGFGNDTVADFEPGLDRFDFRKHPATGFHQLTVANEGHHAVIADGMGNTILVLNAAGLIDADGFIF